MRWRPLVGLAAAGLAGFVALEIALRLFHHDTGFRPEEERYFAHVLSTYCAQEGIPFSSLSEPLAAVRARGQRPFLPNDGHFTGDGAAAAARAVAGWIRAHEAGPAPGASVE